MAQELREAKLEFQEGLGPGHVHEELCKHHQDIASTSWVYNLVGFVKVIPSPRRGFTVCLITWTTMSEPVCIQGAIRVDPSPTEGGK